MSVTNEWVTNWMETLGAGDGLFRRMLRISWREKQTNKKVLTVVWWY